MTNVFLLELGITGSWGSSAWIRPLGSGCGSFCSKVQWWGFYTYSDDNNRYSKNEGCEIHNFWYATTFEL